MELGLLDAKEDTKSVEVMNTYDPVHSLLEKTLISPSIKNIKNKIKNVYEKLLYTHNNPLRHIMHDIMYTTSISTTSKIFISDFTYGRGYYNPATDTTTIPSFYSVTYQALLPMAIMHEETHKFTYHIFGHSYPFTKYPHHEKALLSSAVKEMLHKFDNILFHTEPSNTMDEMTTYQVGQMVWQKIHNDPQRKTKFSTNSTFLVCDVILKNIYSQEDGSYKQKSSILK